MGLSVTSLSLVDFRNYEAFELPDIGGLTIFTGRNGVGKTNILEAIGLLTSGNSFKHSQIGQLIRKGAVRSLIATDVTDGNRHLRTALLLEPGKKRFTVNDKAKQVSDIRGVLPSVSFTPDDLELAKKSSGVKRAALDSLGVQLSKNYSIIQHDFEKSLRYKNRLLKEEAPQAMVDAMSDTLLTCATQLFCYRHSLYKKMMPLVGSYYERISQAGEVFGASYVPSWDYLDNGEEDLPFARSESSTPDKERVREHLERALSRFADEERRRRRSIVGPHNDKITFYLDEGDMSSFASQGQQRSIVLAWKLAEVELTRQTVGVNPILLLDDVMSELDGKRRQMLVETVGTGMQAFMTSTDLSPFDADLVARARVVDLDR